MFEQEAGAAGLDLFALASHQLPSLGDVSHPVQAYLNGLAPSSRRPQLSALEWIARRSTQVFTAETMPWQQLRRAHVLKVRGLLEESTSRPPPTGCFQRSAACSGSAGRRKLMTTEEYQAATSVPAVGGESERRGRDLSAAELRSLFDACINAPRGGSGQDSTARRRRDAAFLALAYGCGLRRSEAVGVDVADLDLISGELRVRRGKGKKPRQVTLPPSAVPRGVPFRGSLAGEGKTVDVGGSK